MPGTPHSSHLNIHFAELGTLLPCNVVVYEQGGRTQIAAVDAERMLSIVGNDQLAETASEVRRRLSAVVDRAVRSPL